MMETDLAIQAPPARQPSRRGMIALVAGAMALFGLGAVGWALLDSMNPAADARLPLWIDLDRIPVGERRTVRWRGVPIFIAHRTPAEIAAARADDGADMPFPEADADRVQRDEWVVLIGVSTYRYWDPPLGQRDDEDRGDWGGWRTRYEHIHYDTSGRVRHGPAYSNLVVPSYKFVSDTRIEIGWPIMDRAGRPL